MAESTENPSEQPDEPREGSATPFLVAVGLVAVLLLAAVMWNWLTPSSELSETDRINRVTADFINVHNNDDEDARTKIVCRDYSEEQSPLAGLEGDVSFVSVDNVQFTGDQATAQVSVNSESGHNTKTWRYVHSGDLWQVCN
ncbi:MAG: hypothetical protein GX542_13785 [Rhodococcus sp.]|nr:hypothetical protein [Rhodococcus sp. (in: high G+C Gram-positive bacteria)]